MVPLKTRILLADDHAMVRRGLRMVLDAEPDLEVVGRGERRRRGARPRRSRATWTWRSST